jgi:hypothetical protein
MKKLWNRISTKPTLFSVLSILLLLVSIPTGIYSYINSDPSTEGWVLTFLLLLYIGLGFFYSLDRLLVKKITPIKLSIAELSFTLICFLLINYSSRELLIDITDSKENYVIIIENNGQLENSKLRSTSFFDNEIVTTDNLIIVNRMPKTTLDRKPSFWGNSHYYNKYSFGKYDKVVLYSNPELNMSNRMSEEFIDSLIERKK